MAGNTVEEYLYHYTSRENMGLIVNSGHIQASTDTAHDAAIGVGVYFTDLAPSVSKVSLLWNNWHTTLGLATDKNVECCIQIPTRELVATGRLRRGTDGLRVIYCCLGGPVILEDFTWSVLNVPDPRCPIM